jgi:hypothetical protein
MLSASKLGEIGGDCEVYGGWGCYWWCKGGTDDVYCGSMLHGAGGGGGALLFHISIQLQ